MDASIEERLVDRCRKGDKEAYGVLAGEYARDVFAVCMSVLGNAADAEDAAQEAFVRGYGQIGGLRKSGRFGQWVMQIARNVCLDMLRRRQAGRKALEAERRRDRNERRSEEYGELEDAISRLDEKYREVLMMYYFGGESSEAVAARLEISPATVLSRLSRARRRLREILGERGETNE